MDCNEARRTMIRSQLEVRGIRNPRVLQAMSRVPRERFVRPEDHHRAYDDCPLAIGHEATISQPYIVALMTEALDPAPAERILEIGSGSGYQSAVLLEMGATVYSVEIVEELSQRARQQVKELGHDACFRVGDGREGWPEAAPFAGILVTAAPRQVPPALVAQLAPRGRMVIPVGDAAQDLILLQDTPSGLKETLLSAVRFVPLLESGHGNQPH
jgi:protein-L-isoaspartate(D-aspartate) O-methyltransferase